MKNKPFVSLLTLNFNRKQLVGRTLTSLTNQKYPNKEIIFLDAGSTDGSVQYVQKSFLQVKTILLHRNMGVAGYNIGMREAKGKYFIIVDSDVAIDPDVTSKVVERFENNPKIGIVAFKCIDALTKQIFSTPGHSQKGDARRGFETAFFNGGAFGYRRKAYEETGGFSEKYFLYINEMRLSARLANKGYEVRYFPDLVIWHTMDPNYVRRTYGKVLMARNMVWYALSYMPITFFPKVFMWFNHGFSEGTSRRHGKASDYIRGFIEGIIGIPYALSEREPVSSSYAKKVIHSSLLTGGYTDKW